MVATKPMKRPGRAYFLVYALGLAMSANSSNASGDNQSPISPPSVRESEPPKTSDVRTDRLPKTPRWTPNQRVRVAPDLRESADPAGEEKPPAKGKKQRKPDQ